jgi:hypothetical protein
MRRTMLAALALALIASGAALAQSAAQFSLGSREVGAVYPLSLTARNENCPQNLNFRFEFTRSPWLRPRGDNRVRGVPTGQSRPLPVLVDLTQMQPGQHTAEVDVVCENCEFLTIRTCGFDRQHLTISVDAVAPATATATPIPADPAPTPPRRVERTPPTTAPQPPDPAPVDAAPAPAPEAAPAPAVVEAPPAQIGPACDCSGQVGLWQALTAGLAALAGVALAGWALTSARAARGMTEATRNLSHDSAPRPDPRQFFQDKIEEAQELVNNERQKLITLLQAQLQAARVLSAFNMLDRAATAQEADAWTATARNAGYRLDEQNVAIVAGRGDGALGNIISSASGAKAQEAFALISASPDVARAEHAQRLAWLQQNGFADSPAAAQAVLSEMTSYLAHGHSMSDMNARLQEQADECRRCDADLAMFVAKSAGG